MLVMSADTRAPDRCRIGGVTQRISRRYLRTCNLDRRLLHLALTVDHGLVGRYYSKHSAIGLLRDQRSRACAVRYKLVRASLEIQNGCNMFACGTAAHRPEPVCAL